jgi:hypothetical protein
LLANIAKNNQIAKKTKIASLPIQQMCVSTTQKRKTDKARAFFSSARQEKQT